MEKIIAFHFVFPFNQTKNPIKSWSITIKYGGINFNAVPALPLTYIWSFISFVMDQLFLLINPATPQKVLTPIQPGTFEPHWRRKHPRSMSFWHQKRRSSHPQNSQDVMSSFLAVWCHFCCPVCTTRGFSSCCSAREKISKHNAHNQLTSLCNVLVLCLWSHAAAELGVERSDYITKQKRVIHNAPWHHLHFKWMPPLASA